MSFVVLTIGTMPVAARFMNDVAFTAFFTFVDHGSAIRGAAVDHGVNDLVMFRRHGPAESVNILGGIFSEDFIYCRHDHPLSSAR